MFETYGGRRVWVTVERADSDDGDGWWPSQARDLDDQGDEIQLRWTDPSGGRAVFVVIQVDGTQARPLLQVDPGQTSVAIKNLDPKAPRYCFQVLALVGDARGLSSMRCTGIRG